MGAQLTFFQNQYREGHMEGADGVATNVLLVAGDSGYRDEQISLYTLLSAIKLKENDFARALSYGNNVLQNSPNLEERIEIYQTLSETHFKNHAYAQALADKDSIIHFRDSIHTIKN